MTDDLDRVGIAVGVGMTAAFVLIVYGFQAGKLYFILTGGIAMLGIVTSLAFSGYAKDLSE